MSSDAKCIFSFIKCITCFMDSILKWVVSQSWFNFFKFKLVRYDPSFLDRITRFEKKSPSWTYVVIITFFWMSLRTSSSIIHSSSCDRFYSNCTLVRMSPVKLSFRSWCTIFKMNISDVMFAQARKMFLKLPPWNLSALIYNSEISMLKFTCFNTRFLVLWFICLVLLFVVIVVALIMWPPLGVLGAWPVFWLIWWKLWPLLIIFAVFHFCPNVFHCWLIKHKYYSEESNCQNCSKCLPKFEHTSPLRFLCISVKEALSALNDRCSWGEKDFNFSNVSGGNLFLYLSQPPKVFWRFQGA